MLLHKRFQENMPPFVPKTNKKYITIQTGWYHDIRLFIGGHTLIIIFCVIRIPLYTQLLYSFHQLVKAVRLSYKGGSISS